MCCCLGLSFVGGRCLLLVGWCCLLVLFDGCCLLIDGVHVCYWLMLLVGVCWLCWLCIVCGMRHNCRLLIAVRCVLFVVCCLLAIVSCSLFVDCCMLFGVCC